MIRKNEVLLYCLDSSTHTNKEHWH